MTVIETADIQRPPKELIEALSKINSATAAGELGHLGVRCPHIVGPTTFAPGKHICGPALTLLLTGNALSLPSMIVLFKVMGKKQAPAYILTIIALSGIAGWLFGELL